MENCDDLLKYREDNGKRDEVYVLLDSLSLSNFGGFIARVTGILADVENDVSIRKSAGMEICRQLTSPSKIIHQIQLEKWTNLDDNTKERVRSLLLKALKSLESNSSDLMVHLSDAIAAVVSVEKANWTNYGFDDILGIIIQSNSTKYTLSASYMALGKIATGLQGTPINISSPDNNFFSRLLRAFDIGLKGQPYQNEDLHYITLDSFSKLVKIEYIEPSTISEQIFLVNVAKTFSEKHKDYTARPTKQKVCKVGVNLLREILLKQEGDDIILGFWTDSLNKGLHAYLQRISHEGMGDVSKHVDVFCQTFDSKFDRKTQSNEEVRTN